MIDNKENHTENHINFNLPKKRETSEEKHYL